MKRSIPALALCALAAPLPAQAQTWTIGEGAPRGPHESAQNFAFEARFAPWQPDIDSEFGGRATPFYDYFGYSERASLTSPEIRRVRDRLLGGLEVDWQALRFGPVASLGVGVGVTYSDFTTTAPVTNGGGGRAARRARSMCSRCTPCWWPASTCSRGARWCPSCCTARRAWR